MLAFLLRLLAIFNIGCQESSSADAEQEGSAPKMAAPGMWKPKVHFVWDALLGALLPESGASHASFPEFFRIVVDGAFFLLTLSV